MAVPAPVAPPPSASPTDEIATITVKGVRKIIAERMLASLQTTAQLTARTLNSSAKHRMLQRKRFKDSPEAWGLRGVTINDLVLFATARSFDAAPDINALFADNTISQYKRVHLGVAVDTPRACSCRWCAMPICSRSGNLPPKPSGWLPSCAGWQAEPQMNSAAAPFHGDKSRLFWRRELHAGVGLRQWQFGRERDQLEGGGGEGKG